MTGVLGRWVSPACLRHAPRYPEESAVWRKDAEEGLEGAEEASPHQRSIGHAGGAYGEVVRRTANDDGERQHFQRRDQLLRALSARNRDASRTDHPIAVVRAQRQENTGHL